MMNERELTELYCSAKPEIQKAVMRMLETMQTATECTHETIRDILIDCNVEHDIIERFETEFNIPASA